MKRRDFITFTAGAALTGGTAFTMLSQDQGAATVSHAAESIKGSSLKQPPLPYKLNALAPFLSEEQMNYHYNKHHAAYFKKLGELLGSDASSKTLEEIIMQSSGALFNNAAQAWNHTFFWNCMSPLHTAHNEPANAPREALLTAINRDFGDYGKFLTQFKTAAATLFGSGWTWLAKNREGALEILQMSNAETPLKVGKKPILVIDVWEHAYYVDYRNERAKFIDGFVNHINWSFAEKQWTE